MENFIGDDNDDKKEEEEEKEDQIKDLSKDL